MTKKFRRKQFVVDYGDLIPDRPTLNMISNEFETTDTSTVCASCILISVFTFVNPWLTTLISLTSGLHYICAFFSCLAFSSPSLAAHYEIRQCVLLQICQWWGTPSPLAGPLFRFLISSVVFFFPSQPGTSCRGNDNTRGKQQRLITSPPTYSRSQLARSFLQNWSFSVHVACSTFRPTSQSALLLVSSTGLWPLTHEIDTSLCLAQTRETHTLADLVSLLLSFFSHPLSCTRNLGCVL